MPSALPKTLNELKLVIAEQHQSLSKRLRQVAQYLVDHPNQIAFGTVATIAKDAEVHPSTLVRFANAFGFSGFSEMQRLFQQQLLHESPSYSDRMRIARESLGEDNADPVNLLGQFASANSATLDQLISEVDADALRTAEEFLAAADTVYIIGVRRAFVVASYFAYALRHAERRAFLVDSIGGLTKEQGSSVRKGDALIAVSFHPYATETQDIVKDAASKGVPVVLITDSQLSPLAPLASSMLIVKEADVHGIRSLSASLCIAQALSISLANRSTREA
jgi:DNA-binding MurR/RpiR family transcriptional regulator